MFVAFIAASCIRVGVGPIDVTPEALPAELEGARWQEAEIEYCVVASDEGFIDHGQLVRLTEEAFRTWGVATVNTGDCPSEQGSGNRRNEIGWGALPQRQDRLHEAGITQVLYRPCPSRCGPEADAQIVEADITIHSSPPQRLRNEDCLFATLLHEAGHFLGVPHLESPAVMAPVTFDCPQELTQANFDALRRLYPSLSSVERE